MPEKKLQTSMSIGELKARNEASRAKVTASGNPKSPSPQKR